MHGRTALFTANLVLLVGVGSAQAATGTIATVAGTGVSGFSGDGGPAAAAQLAIPVAVVGTPGGGYLIADQANNRIRRVGPDGTITTVAGSGTGPGYSGDGGPATSAKLDAPSGVAQLGDGSVIIADINNNAVRKVAPDGRISTVVGNGSATFGGDGGPASAAKVSFPYDIAPLPSGGYLIVDQDNNRIRKVDAAGTITTVAGSGAAGAGGDGGPATAAQLNDPSGVALTPDGGFVIADTNNNRIRRVAPDGTISTLAGSSAGFAGDNGPATAAKLNGPVHLAVSPDGGVVIADWHNNRIRKVDAAGTITTIVGDGTAGSAGDGGTAGAAKINGPFGVGIVDGDVLIADTLGHRIRRADFGDPVPAPGPTPGPGPVPAPVPPTAVLSLPTTPVCVGTQVIIDGLKSIAGSGGPIVKYEFRSRDEVSGKAMQLDAQIAAIQAGIAQTQYTWNRALDAAQQSLILGVTGGLSQGLGQAAARASGRIAAPIPTWVRDPADVTLTVTDASGRQSSTTRTVAFAQPTNTAPRTPCGDAASIEKQKIDAATTGPALMNSSAVQLGLGCAGSATLGCTGTVIGAAPSSKVAEALAGYYQQQDRTNKEIDRQQLAIEKATSESDKADEGLQNQKDHLRAIKDSIKKLLDLMSQIGPATAASARAAPATTAKPKKKPRAVTLAAASYLIPRGGKATVKLPLSTGAKAIVKRHGYLVLRRVVVAVGPTGRQTVKAKTIVLKVKRAEPPARKR